MGLLGADHAGGDGVDPHSGCPLDRQGLGEAEDSRLGGPVRGGARGGADAAHAGDVEDAAALLLLLHHGIGPLREVVRQTTDIIERMCIEAALELTGDNRASAAEMLGVSRQSLYIKLRRHQLGKSENDAH